MNKQITNYKLQTINKSQYPISKNWKFAIFVFIVCDLVSWNLVFAKHSLAQTLGLSISPPIGEIMIMPGKEVSQTFIISNDGEDGMASIYIVPFRAQGENGAVSIEEKNTVSGSSPFSSWFSISSPVASFGEKFYLGAGQSKNVNIKISVPPNTPQKDYYFTLLYELDGVVPGSFAQTGSAGQARIGSNILISVSDTGSPTKNPNIVEFSAPKIIDSLQPLAFKIKIGNQGAYFFKTNGQITIKPTFGKSETLTLAPLNVIAASVRNIPCLEGEEMVSCKSGRKVLAGIYKSTLSIKADGDGTVAEKTATTVAFPFSIIVAAAFIIEIYRLIKNTKNKAEIPLDKG